ncbi:hypothetical protein QBC36DRAFT_330307 [Triangularia setosa]|uniref:F-box domain-containing protein n=1 Tax=Triangularia setosa TaxID=2587417 RepID=A0AAN6W5S5_9PEZI|nr:hypothetical protein QBC36DRAFT_330307 [Podospora setosa]
MAAAKMYAQGQRLVLDELPVEIIVEIAANLDFEGVDNMLRVSSFVRCILQKYWRAVMPFVIEREFSPVDLFFHAFSSSFDAPSTTLIATAKTTSACQWLGRLRGLGISGGKGLDSLLNFCRSVRLWEGELQRLRFHDCEVEHARLLSERERERARKGLYSWGWFARLYHSGRQGRGTREAVGFMRKLSTTELHELADLWETVWAGVGREVCPSTSTVLEVMGNKAQAEGIGWGDGEENAQILGTVMKLGPTDVLKLMRERWRFGSKMSLVSWVRMREPWIEDSTEMLRVAIMSAKHEKQRMMGMARWPFLVDGFPGRYGGVLDHETVESEELRVLHGVDGGREWCHSGRYENGHGREVFVLGGVREGRLVASRS